MPDDIVKTLVDSAYLESFCDGKRTVRWFQMLAHDGVISSQKVKGAYRFQPARALKQTILYLIEQVDSFKQPANDLELEKRKMKAEVTLKESKASMAKLELHELQGKMHRSEDVAAMTEDLIYSVRGMLIALPGRLAVDAAAMSEAAEVSELIRGEVYHIMENIAGYAYDPKKYEERVRERINWDKVKREEDADEEG